MQIWADKNMQAITDSIYSTGEFYNYYHSNFSKTPLYYYKKHYSIFFGRLEIQGKLIAS